MGHHYVPRFYLKNFAFNEEEKTLVYPMTKEGMIPIEPNDVGDICQKANYNTPQQEQKQNQLETYYSGVLEEFIQNPKPGNTKLSEDFVKFVCFMMGNNIFIREKIMEGLSSRLKVVMKGDDFNHTLLIDKSYRGKYELSLAFSDKVYKELQSWTFARTGELGNGKFFITSDNPVGIFYSDNLSTPIEFDITFSFSSDMMPISVDKVFSGKVPISINVDSVSFPQDVVMIFPITPSFCMLGFSDKGRHASYASFMRGSDRNNDPLALINIMIYASCNRAVYSHSIDFLKGIRADKQNFKDYCSSNGLIPSFGLVLGEKLIE